MSRGGWGVVVGFGLNVLGRVWGSGSSGFGVGASPPESSQVSFSRDYICNHKRMSG